MLKQFAVFIGLSILLVLFASYAQQGLIYIDLIYSYVSVYLAEVFQSGPMGIKIQKMLTLILLPLIITGIPASIYWAFKRNLMPYFFHTLWVVWLIILISHVMIR